MRHINTLIITFAIVFTGCCNRSSQNNYPNSDAVYLNLTKTFILNEDGSSVKKFEKTQKLFTYRAFHSLYGDTRISYNPAFERLNVTESFTVMADGKKVPTPKNGYNEVLPRVCAGSKAYNHLREMVVTHTGLEREAVIHCDWEIERTAGEMPFLSGNESLVTSCPIEKLQIVVKVPKNTALHYRLLNTDVQPKIKKGTKHNIYIWQFKDLPQHIHEKMEPAFHSKIPRLLFTTIKNTSQALDFLTREGFSNQNLDKQTTTKVSQFTKDKNDITEKTLEIQRRVVNNLNLLPISPGLIACKARPAQQTWDSNSGTPTEKSVLMAAILKALGIKAEVCLRFPSVLNRDEAFFLSDATPFVKAWTSGTEPISLSATHLNANSSEFNKPGYSVISLETGTLSEPAHQNKGEIQITGKLTLDKKGNLKAELQEKLTGSYNPRFNILRNSFSGFLTGLKGEIKTQSPQQTEIFYKGQYKNKAEIRGGYCFVSLPQCIGGVESKNLLPLGSTRQSPLSFGNPLEESFQITLSVPMGWQLIHEPITADLSTTDGLLSIRINSTDNKISIFKKLSVSKEQIDPINYPSFKKLINLWHLKKHNLLVFRIPEEN